MSDSESEGMSNSEAEGEEGGGVENEEIEGEIEGEGEGEQLSADGEPIKKRANHNELERKRRQAQKLRLLELRQVVPAIRLEKPSAIQILAQAKEYIEELTKKSEELDDEITAITGRKSVASTQTPKAPAKTKGKGSKGSRAEEAAELESIRKENAELKARLESLEKKASNESPHNGARSLTPSQLQTLSSRELTSSPSSTTTRSFLMAINSLHSDSQHRSSGEAESSPSPSPTPSRSNSQSPLSRPMSPEASGMKVNFFNDQPLMMAPMENSLQVNYKKRKSRADNDFEVAKREYYSRRNSTVEDLRDQQQRISEVGLLTNFAVQARRASLPSAFLDGWVPPHDDD